MSTAAYQALIDRKLAMVTPVGIAAHDVLHQKFFPHQNVLTAWALRRGCAAIFADTGLGKSGMQLLWAQEVCRYTGGDVLILAPLAVASQTVAEGVKFGIPVILCRDMSDVRSGINITNYERLHRFEASHFSGVVLDESSLIKHHNSKTLQALLAAFVLTQFKLCATATPAPNDWTEIGTHAEFLGICRRTEMLSEFFVHDGGESQTWRLKGHAREPFWRWVASWGAMIRSPADLGFDASAYQLPPLTVHEHLVESSIIDGHLFHTEAQTLSERREARRASLTQRVEACAAVVAAESDEPFVIFCDLNAEGDALEKSIPNAIQVAGSDDIDVKEERLSAFTHGTVTKLVSKSSICGWGLNWHHCARMAFVGVTDSFEAYYQSIRRIWRFGQKRPVHIHVFASAAEGAVVANLKRKEADALEMAQSLTALTAEAVRNEVLGTQRYTNPYVAEQRIRLPVWLS